MNIVYRISEQDFLEARDLFIANENLVSQGFACSVAVDRRACTPNIGGLSSR
jgi:hypothetical protein